MFNMFLLRKLSFSKCKLPFTKEGRKGKQDVKNLGSNKNVNEDYAEAFRKRSCGQACNNIKGLLEMKTILVDEQSLSPTLFPSLVHQVYHSDYFLEPQHENPASIQESMNPQIFSDYILISLEEAFQICEVFLKNIHQVRINYYTMKSEVEHIKREQNVSSWTNEEYFQGQKSLTSFASQINPFSMVKPEEFHESRRCLKTLYQELTSLCNKTKRRTKPTQCIKMAKETCKVVGCGAMAIILTVLAMHSMIGSMVTPILAVCFLGISIIKKMKRRLNKHQVERLYAHLDVASGWVYALINYIDTISMLVMICDCEMKCMKMLADTSARKGRTEVFKKAINEFQMQESCFMEQLEELEKHVYLGILNITRSRRLVKREMN